MKTFNVRLAETFLWDMIDITLFILEKSVNTDIPRKFREDVLAAIEERSFGADSYESYYLRFIENTPTSKHSCVGGGSVQDAFRKRKTSIKTPTHYMYNGYGIIKETQEPDKSCNLS